jgi:hypothetical protein
MDSESEQASINEQYSFQAVRTSSFFLIKASNTAFFAGSRDPFE